MVDRSATGEQHVGAMRSTIAWALLGLVIERPGYGYELAQRFRRVYGETLALSNITRIYTALDALRVRSLIEEIPEPEPELPPTRHPKPRYRATEQGVGAYQDWLFAQLDEERQRHRLFVRQIAMLEPEAALEVLDEYERECLGQTGEPSPPASEREVVAARLAEGEERLTLEVRLSWIEYARHELQALIGKRGERAAGGEDSEEGSEVL
jgi:DNA-binding PadR family transcriptional regulator